jgi:DNA segregation ATPase FtsK/SpoIIIE-like protein
MVQKRRGSGGSISTKAQRWMGLSLVALGFFLLAALLTYNAGAYRSAWERNEAFFPFSEQLVNFSGNAAPHGGPLAGVYHNAGGGLGLWLASLVLHLLGWIVVWVIPAGLIAWGWNRLFVQPVRPLLWRSIAGVPLVITLAAIASVLLPGTSWGGRIGAGLWQGVHGVVGPVGGILLLGTAGIGFFFLEAEAWDGRRGEFTRNALTHARNGLLAVGRALLRMLMGIVRWIRSRPWESGVSVSAQEAELSKPVTSGGQPAFEEEIDWTPKIVDHEAEERLARAQAPAPVRTPVEPRSEPAGYPVHREAPPTPAPVSRPVSTPAPAPLVSRSGPSPVTAGPAPAPSQVSLSSHEDPIVHKLADPLGEGTQDVEDAVMEARLRATPGKTTAASRRRRRGAMTLPPLDTLDDVPDTGPPVEEEELKENSKILTQTLLDFGIIGKVGEVHPGPVITRYEYIPGPGVKVSQILNRQDDLALKLRASRIRILAPIPGKAAVGIEVPNRKPTPIFLRRLLETRAFEVTGGPLPLAMGKDISGAPVTAELSRMPHLLIAGTTGSGKSVCMNALITSLLVKRTPAELRMLMIDPKMLELPMYNGIPHLLTDVVTDPKVAVRSFRWALVEMETRYRILAARGCRNLASYNAKMDKEGPVREGEEKLPYIVILIDELADLMMTSGKEVEEPIARLAQTARAVGIHLIVATQRPSVDVITGIIKANFPTRIAFQVASRTDSRTILDQNGAESLLGKGDMLYLPPGQAAPLRVHGAFVSEEETQRLAEAWRVQGEPESCTGLEEVLAEPESTIGSLGDDELFEDAARLVVVAGQASASLLQRRLKVGYARAARLVDMLEGAGVVGAQDGSKAREVLVDEVRLEHVLSGAEN